MGRVDQNEQAQPNMGVPVTGIPQQQVMVGNPWQTSLFDCHVDQTNAAFTTILPCVTFGQVAEVLDEGELTCPLGSFMYMLMIPALCSHWVLGSKYRAKLRKKYNLVEAPYEDALSHILFPTCALAQEYRELQLRGLPPALGWNGILAAQQQANNQQAAQTAPQYQNMSM
jgi:Cys-rich protein (TIGR01571 family)